jgi:hypothetical protein
MGKKQPHWLPRLQTWNIYHREHCQAAACENTKGIYSKSGPGKGKSRSKSLASVTTPGRQARAPHLQLHPYKSQSFQGCGGLATFAQADAMSLSTNRHPLSAVRTVTRLGSSYW